MEFPDEAPAFIKTVMLCGALSGVCVSIPCIAFLYLNWDRCGYCNRPLRVWVLLHSVLQLLQAPIRMRFVLAISEAEKNNSSIEECVQHLTTLKLWKGSKALSAATYAWFVLGIVWILNSTHCHSCPGVYRLNI